MQRRKIIAEILSISNDMDKIGMFKEANNLTAIAQKLVLSFEEHPDNLGGPTDEPLPNENSITQEAIEIMWEKLRNGEIPDDKRNQWMDLIVDMNIPDDIWQQAIDKINGEMDLEEYDPEFE